MCDDGNSIVTQQPCWKLTDMKTLYIHVGIAVAISSLQVYYDLLGNGRPEEIPIWMMATANLMVSVLGSVRFFDVLVIAELVIALTVAFFCKWHLFFPIILIMIHQAVQRIEKSMGIEPTEEQMDELREKIRIR
uniref:Transmembrane protein n=1 Tax=Caenorhabditis tropicalis TaxID=1561998 RepID=A0A1I7TWX4_9PELO